MSSIDKLLRPGSIVTFGGAEAACVIEQCQMMGYGGEIYPVHPDKDSIGGLPVYRCLADLPQTPDAAFIGVNRYLTIEIVRQLAAAGVGGASCYASGFRELDAEGDRLQKELLVAAGDMPIIGPNSYGILNYLDGVALWPDQHGGGRLSADQSGVAIVTQSSNIAISITMQQRALPIAYIVTAGNQAQIGLARIAMDLLDDSRVTALGLHIEGFDDVALMQQLAGKARRVSKPIIVLKVGRSEQAQQTTLSHTASMAGSDTAASAFLTRLGIARVQSIPEFLESLKLLHVTGPLPGSRISSMSCSGGEASLIADAALKRQLSFPVLSAHRKQQLQDVLGPRVTVSNPLDYHTYIWADEAAMKAAFQAMMGPEFDFNLLALDFPRMEICDDADWTIAVNAFKAALNARKEQHPATAAAIVSSLPENLANQHAQVLMDAGIVPLCGFDDAMLAIDSAVAIGRAWQEPEARPLAVVPAKRSTPVLVSDALARQSLAEYGLSMPRGFVVTSVDEAVARAEQLDYPVVAKVLGMAHKTEANAVRLNLRDADSVRSHASKLLSMGDQISIDAMIEGSQMELLVGLKSDEQFGFVLTLGSGGILVEILKDFTTLLLPCSTGDIEQALLQLRCARLFDGYRGQPKADVAAVIENILILQDYALANSESLLELEINPLLVCAQGQGAYAADILLTTRNT